MKTGLILSTLLAVGLAGIVVLPVDGQCRSRSIYCSAPTYYAPTYYAPTEYYTPKKEVIIREKVVAVVDDRLDYFFSVTDAYRDAMMADAIAFRILAAQGGYYKPSAGAYVPLVGPSAGYGYGPAAGAAAVAPGVGTAAAGGFAAAGPAGVPAPGALAPGALAPGALAPGAPAAPAVRPPPPEPPASPREPALTAGRATPGNVPTAVPEGLQKYVDGACLSCHASGAKGVYLDNLTLTKKGERWAAFGMVNSNEMPRSLSKDKPATPAPDDIAKKFYEWAKAGK